MHIQLSLYFHFYLLYLRLNSCDGNDAFCRSSMVVKQSSSFSRKHRTLSLQICVHRISGLMQERVHTCPRYQPLWPATWSSASLTHGQSYHKTLSTKQLVIGECGYMQTWGKRTSLWTSAKLKPALFRANTLHNRLFSEPPAVYRGKHVRTLIRNSSTIRMLPFWWPWVTPNGDFKATIFFETSASKTITEL